MPIHYDVYNNGHFVLTQTSGEVTSDEFVGYEIAHAIDNRVITSVDEIMLVYPKSLDRINNEDINRIIRSRKKIQKLPLPHRCAIVVTHSDTHSSWDLAKFYKGMVMLHSLESVIVFGDEAIAYT